MSEHPLVTADVELAARLLADGGLVGMPTETVYGLAADAEDVAAVARIFAVKGRPADHPLIVHLAGAHHLDVWAQDVPEYARRLADRLWPGPLSLVLSRTHRAGDHVTGGLDTVALRVPSHPVARRLLDACGAGRGLAAPSANRFGRVSPTTAAHVLDELGALLMPGRDVVLEGGPSEVGVESAIVDCTGPSPRILRPGAVTPAQLAEIGRAGVAEGPGRIRVPGTLPSHYAPRARVDVVDDPADLPGLLAAPDGTGPRVRASHGTSHGPAGGRGPFESHGLVESHGPVDGLLAPAQVPTPDGVVRLSAPADPTDYARVLYAALREADALGLQRVLAVPPAAVGVGTAVLDRLRRAAHRD